jgi:copper transport protein
VRRALIAVGIAFVAVLMLAAPAGAHAVLEDTNPASGQAYPQPPTSVSLTFDEHVQVGLGGIRLFDAKGHRIDIGAPTQAGNAKTVTVSLPKLEQGTYVVTWRVISADGHPVQNSFIFSVGQPSATLADTSTLANQLLASEGGSRTVGVINGSLRFVEFAAAGLLLGGFAFVVICWPAGRRSRRTMRLLTGAWVAAFVGAIASVLIESSYTAGLGIADSFKPSIVHQYIDTHVGHVMVARIVVLVAVAVLGRVVLRRASLGIGRSIVAVALGLATIATFTLAGHARSGIQINGAIPADLAHVAAFALWFGGLVVLAVAVLRPDDPSELEPAVTRFSNLALGCVVVLTGTGVYQGWRQVGSFGALKSTTYGRLLLVKVALVAVVVLMAALSRDTVRQRLGAVPETLEEEEAREPLPVGPGAALADLDFDSRAETAHRLRISVAIEVVFLVAVLATTALLVNAPPARSAVNAPYATTLQGKGITFEVLLAPSRSGANEMHITALRPNGSLYNLLGLDISLSDPAKGIAPLKVTLIRLGPGHYTSNGLIIPFKGKWQMEIKALVSQIDEVDVNATVPVRG